MANRLKGVPYTGDDWAQALARTLWFPMLAMGLMAVALGLVTGIYSGIEIGDFFGGGTADDLGRGTATMAWTTGVIFLGMGFLLSAITMTLVNIVRTLRDTGRDVQVSVRAREILKLEKPLTGHLIPWVMMMGLMAVMGGFVVSIVQATLFGGLPAAGLADPSSLSGGNLADFGAAQAINGWLRPLLLSGLALIFASIVLALRTIIKTIRYQAQRIEDLGLERQTQVA